MSSRINVWSFANDLTYSTSSSEISMYAQLMITKYLQLEVKTELEHDVNTTTRWYEDNFLCLNFDKFQTMVMGPRNKENTMNIDISGNIIEQSTSIKLLGIEVDEQLNFNKHISELCKGTSRQTCRSLDATKESYSRRSKT